LRSYPKTGAPFRNETVVSGLAHNDGFAAQISGLSDFTWCALIVTNNGHC